MQIVTQRKRTHWLAAIGLMMVSAVAMAGGLEAGTQAATNFKIWFYSFVGVLAVIYLTWKGLECWGGRASWVHDFGLAIAGVAATGATIVLAPWAWNLATS